MREADQSHLKGGEERKRKRERRRTKSEGEEERESGEGALTKRRS